VGKVLAWCAASQPPGIEILGVTKRIGYTARFLKARFVHGGYMASTRFPYALLCGVAMSQATTMVFGDSPRVVNDPYVQIRAFRPGMPGPSSVFG
jgi:hypothetical protein